MQTPFSCTISIAYSFTENITICIFQPLDDASEKELQTALSAFTKKGEKILLTKKIDPSILGGMVVSIGDKYVDMSIATKIKTYTKIIKDAV